MQNNLSAAKNFNSPPASATSAITTPEEIPLTISASLSKQSSLPQTRTLANYHSHSNGGGKKRANSGGSSSCTSSSTNSKNDCTNENDANDSSDSNDDDNDCSYKNNLNQYSHYSTLYTTPNGKHARDPIGHVHGNVRMNNNNTIASSTSNRYRWHNQSNALSSSMSSSIRNAIPANANTNAGTMPSSHRIQQKHHHHHYDAKQNQINNNFIVAANKKHSMHGTNNDFNCIDKNNGNHFPLLQTRTSAAVAANTITAPSSRRYH